jgi:hypothetical protein
MGNAFEIPHATDWLDQLATHIPEPAASAGGMELLVMETD